MKPMTLDAPLPPPAWAASSIAEDRFITHETISAVEPRAVVEWPPIERDDVQPVQVSLSVVDRFVGGRWIRGEPTVQVEGGAYPLDEVVELLRALLDVTRLTRAA